MEKKKLPAAETREKRIPRNCPPLPSAAPWLVLPCKKNQKNQAFYNLLEPNKRNCRKRIPEMSRKSFWQSPSHEGWLVIVCNDPTDKSNSIWKYGDCFLWNPLSLENIKLPNLLNWLDYDKYTISSCILTSPPSNNNNKTSMVFFLLGLNEDEDEDDEGASLLVYCRPGDKQWRSHELLSENINKREIAYGSLLCVKGKLYIFFWNEWHFEIEIKNKFEADEFLSITLFSTSEPFLSIGRLCPSRLIYVVSSDELFRVTIFYNSREHFLPEGKSVITIEILQLDFSLMHWKNVTSLGNHVLFLGHTTTTSCSAAELSLKRGCVYYTLNGDPSLYKYDIEGPSTSVCLPFLNLPMPCLSSEWVMMPPTLRACEGRRENIFMKDNEAEDNITNGEDKKINTNDDENEVSGQDKDREELENANPLGILNRDTLVLLASYLPPVDYIHFRAVHRENRSVLPATIRNTFGKTDTKITSLSPLMVFSEGNIYNFVDPMHNNEKYTMDSHDIILGATIRFSKDGWLLMTKGKDSIFFYNPVTRMAIQLPPLPFDFNNMSTGLSFSSSPTSSDCEVIGITQFIDEEDYEEKVFVIFTRRGKNTWWSGNYPKSDIFRYCFDNPVFCNGAFYFLDYNGTMGVLETNSCLFMEVYADPRWQFDDSYKKFLVECKGKLLLIDLGHLGLSIRVFELDFTSLTWGKIESLGKDMMFISNTCCLLRVAPNSRMENKIYFPRLHGEDILCYSLDTGKCQPVGSQSCTKGFYDTYEPFNCSWLEPTYTRSPTVEELDWFHVI